MVNCFPRARAARVPISALAVSVRTSGSPRSTLVLPTALLALCLLSSGAALAAPAEVWISSNPFGSEIFRTDLAGNTLPSISTGWSSGYVRDWAIVGSEVWGTRGGGISRFATDGTLLGEFDPNPSYPNQSVIQVIPEPSTALLLGIGLTVLAVRRGE